MNTNDLSREDIHKLVDIILDKKKHLHIVAFSEDTLDTYTARYPFSSRCIWIKKVKE